MRYDFVNVDKDSGGNQLVTAITNYCSKKLQIEIPKVKYFTESPQGNLSHDKDSSWGMAFIKQGYFAINTCLLNSGSDDIVYTVAHECMHFFQSVKGFGFDEDLANEFGDEIVNLSKKYPNDIINEGRAYAGLKESRERIADMREMKSIMRQ